MSLIILGGGYLGQLLHTLLPEARVLDWRPTAPTQAARSFGPQYLWTPIPGLACTDFPVITYVDDKPATPEAVMAYKQKVGKDQDGSDWRTQFMPSMRGWEAMLPRPQIEYNQRVLKVDLLRPRRLEMASGEVIHFDWLINTIPLPAFMDLCSMSRRVDGWQSRPIYVWTKPVDALSYLYVNYISDPGTPVYRRTVREGLLHSESLEPVEPRDGKVHRLLPGKIYRSDQTAVTLAELETHRVLSVGRYGAWDPEQLAHETYAHVRAWKERIWR